MKVFIILFSFLLFVTSNAEQGSEERSDTRSLRGLKTHNPYGTQFVKEGIKNPEQYYADRSMNYQDGMYSTGSTCRDCRRAIRDSHNNGACSKALCRQVTSQRGLPGVGNNCNDLCDSVNDTTCNPHQACTSLGLCSGNRNDGGSCNTINNENIDRSSNRISPTGDLCSGCLTTLQGSDSDGVCKASTCRVKAMNRGYVAVSNSCNELCEAANNHPQQDWVTQACQSMGFCSTN